MKSPQQILIEYMRAKREFTGLPVSPQDEKVIRSWTDKDCHGYILSTLGTVEERISLLLQRDFMGEPIPTHWADDLICPFCLRYEDPEECSRCEYGVHHGECSKNSSWGNTVWKSGEFQAISEQLTAKQYSRLLFLKSDRQRFHL